MIANANQPIADLINELVARGVTLWIERGEVRMRGPLSGCAHQLEDLGLRKQEVVEHLSRDGNKLRNASSASILIDQNETSTFASSTFLGMLDLDRLISRSDDFDRMVLSSDDHSWNPLDKRYLDFETPFDVRSRPVVDEGAFMCLQAPSVALRLSAPTERIGFVNKIAWMRFSNLLHGEQGALNLSASLCGILRDQGAQEFAANQTREEARHVTAFSRYIKVRWGRPAPVLPALRDFLLEIIETPDVSKKIIGMQVMVEGLAMGSLGSLFRVLLDPVGKRLVQLVMTDEAFHHRFGKLWADRTMPNLSAVERSRLESWTSHCLHSFIVKMNPPIELQVLFKEYGLDPMKVAREIQGVSGTQLPDTALGSKEIFRVLTQTLLNAGLLSRSSQAAYQEYIETGLSEEAGIAYDDIVEDGLAYLRRINEHRRVVAEV